MRIAPNAKCQRVLVLAVCLIYNICGFIRQNRKCRMITISQTGDFSISFRIAAAAVMIFFNFKFLTVSTVKRVNMCHHTNFVEIGITVAEIWLFCDF